MMEGISISDLWREGDILRHSCERINKRLRIHDAVERDRKQK